MQNHFISTLEELRELLPIQPGEEKTLTSIVRQHPLRISKYYLSLIDKNDPADPIRKLAIPSVEELHATGVYDTSGEASNTVFEGLQHKYKETALLLTTDECAMYCRFCFRKRLVGLGKEETLKIYDEAFAYIRAHEEISNVLVSGGDPLTLPNEMLEHILAGVCRIDHVDFVRVGTRMPVVMPERLTEDPRLIDLFRKYSRKNRRLAVVTHFNHPREITPESTEAINQLLSAGVPVNNQMVLLRGINDDPDILVDLLRNLTRIGVMPYYVFQCRPVRRVKHHFQVSVYESFKIVEKAKRRLNGLAKRFKFIMSHRTGKIEILGYRDELMFFKYHQAKNRENLGRILVRKLDKKAGWLDEFEKI